MTKIGETVSKKQLEDMIRAVDTDQSGTVEWNEFLDMIYNLHHKGESNEFSRVFTKHVELNVVEGKGNAKHTYSNEEKIAFCDHINSTLGADVDCEGLLPLNPESDDLFQKVSNGVLLIKLINASVPGTIDERAMNKKPKNAFTTRENGNLVINSAKAIGCHVVNVGAEDLEEGAPHLILGLIWQIVKMGLFAQITLQDCPYLFRLLEEGEELDVFSRMPPEHILIRWFNYHLKEAGWEGRVHNFTTDIKDSKNYTVLLSQLAQGVCTREPLALEDPMARAEAMLENAALINCRKFVTASDVCKGHPKLNLAFVANLFNTHPGLEPPTEEEVEKMNIDFKDLYGDESDSREERAFRMWINALGLEPQVRNLFEDTKDGLVLLKMFDKISPGIVDWRKVNLQCPNKFKKVENCNYVVLLGKQLKFSLVGIGGSDIVDGNKKLTLSLIWQAMKYNLTENLKNLKVNGKTVDDAGMLQWANTKVAQSGKQTKMAKFNDSSLSNSHFFLDLLSACDKRSVDYDVVQAGESEEQKSDNAKYAITLARKMGCTVFLLWEDIVEVKPKMTLTFVAEVMRVYGNLDGSEPSQ